eukprot:gene4798-8023_t
MLSRFASGPPPPAATSDARGADEELRALELGPRIRYLECPEYFGLKTEHFGPEAGAEAEVDM